MTEPPRPDLPAPVTRVTAAVPSAKGWTMFEENGQDEVGVVVDQRFEILARIGDGGMARVYACRDLGRRSEGRQAATRVLTASASGEHDEVEAWLARPR